MLVVARQEKLQKGPPPESPKRLAVLDVIWRGGKEIGIDIVEGIGRDIGIGIVIGTGIGL